MKPNVMSPALTAHLHLGFRWQPPYPGTMGMSPGCLHPARLEAVAGQAASLPALLCSAPLLPCGVHSWGCGVAKMALSLASLGPLSSGRDKLVLRHWQSVMFPVLTQGKVTLPHACRVGGL